MSTSGGGEGEIRISINTLVSGFGALTMAGLLTFAGASFVRIYDDNILLKERSITSMGQIAQLRVDVDLLLGRQRTPNR